MRIVTVGIPARFRTAALAGAALLAAAGCAGAADDWIRTAPDVAERARTEPASFVEAARAQWDGLDGMVGSYRVRASRGINSRSLDTQIYLLRDAYVEIVVLAPTFQSEGYLGAGAREVGLWVSEDACLYRGPNQPGAFGRALGLELTPEQVVATLMGFAVSAADQESVAWDADAGRIRVSGGGTSAWLHPLQRRFERLVVDGGAGPIEVEYLEWPETGPPVPLRLRIEVTAEDITLDLRLASSWNANPEGLDVAYFDVPPIADTVDCALEDLAVEGGLLRRGLGR